MEADRATYLTNMIKHTELSDAELRSRIRKNEIQFGGYAKARIYGTLRCKSGQRMRRENRVFFTSEQEARENGYRPCAHCMQAAYKQWKAGADFL